MSRRPSLKSVGLAGAVTALCLVLLEILARRFLPAGSPIEQRFPVEVMRQPRPYTMFGGAPQGRLAAAPGVEERLNSLGYRGPEPAAIKPAGEFRVFVVGGSTVVEGEPPLPVLLEAQLRQRGLAEVRCFNYGVISSVSGMDLARILFEVADRQPDLVVLFSGGNDLLSPLRYDPRPGYPFNFIAYENNPLLQRDLASYPTLTLLAYGSHLLRALAPGFFAERFVHLEDVRRAAGYGGPAWREAIAVGYVANVSKSERVARAFGADFVAFFQPLVFFKASPGPQERQMTAVAGEVTSVCRDLRQRTLRELERGQREQGLVARDLSGAFDTVGEDLFYDFIHVSAAGKEILAQRMAEDLAPRIQSRRAAAALP